MGRPVKATIHLDALRHNLKVVRKLKNAKVCGVVKCDAYGHGALRVSKVLEQERIDALAVACMEEAVSLREGGIKCPVLLLEGCFLASELSLVEKYNLIMQIHHRDQVDALLQFRPKSPLSVWIKIDTGMNRLGFISEDFFKQYLRLKSCSHVRDIVVSTHFSCSDNPESPYTYEQIESFNHVVRNINEATSLSSSAAILHDYGSKDDWVRPGLMLTGSSPLPVGHHTDKLLKPVMELTADVIAIKEIPENSPIGYGATCITKRNTRMGVVPIGYGDGYPREISKQASVIVCGKKAPLLGRVSMDTLSVDLTDIPESGIGSSIELWGQMLPVSEVARYASSIPYTLTSGIQRISREYVDNLSSTATFVEETINCESSFSA